MTILLPLAAATLATGCTTFSDNDAVARVNDVELSSETLAELARSFPDNNTGVSAAETDATHARSVAGLWIVAHGLEEALTSQGLQISQSSVDGAVERLEVVDGFDQLSESANDLLIKLVASQYEFSLLDGGQELIVEALDQLDVYVDPRFGVFDPPTGTIVPLG